jgi:hypothetical protein
MPQMGITIMIEQLYDQFLRDHMKMFLGNLNAKVGREDIFKLIIGNEST